MCHDLPSLVFSIVTQNDRRVNVFPHKKYVKSFTNKNLPLQTKKLPFPIAFSSVMVYNNKVNPIRGRKGFDGDFEI